MKVRSEPEVRPALDPGEPAHSLKRKVKRGYKIPKAGDSFGYRELGMSRTLTTGVPDSRNVKRRNPEIGTPTKNVADREITPFWGPEYRELKCQNNSSQECRNVESLKHETPKSRNRHTNKELCRPGNNSISESQIPGVEVSKHFITGVPKC
jgi:hypothetical protein